MSEYVLFLPPTYPGGSPMTEATVRESIATVTGQASATGNTDGLIAAQAFDNAAKTVRMSESAGVERVSSDAQAYLQRIEETSAGAMEASHILTEATAIVQDRRDVTTFGTLGAIAVETLSDDERKRLTAAGFEVVPNVRTYAGPITAAEAADDAPWSVTRCGIDRQHHDGYEGRGLRIGILDTGIDAGHDEFKGKDIEFAEFDSMGRLIGTTPRDSGQHGTHVSAIAAGRTVGAAPAADLAVAAVLTQISSRGNYGDLAQIIAGLEWLIGVHATGNASSEVCVVNASLGGEGFNTYLMRPIRRARTLGVPFVASIGNAGPREGRHGSPGNYGLSIGVGASDFKDEIADFSDWGTVSAQGGIRKPDLCAPGAAIRSAIPGGYAVMSGTSMAAPCVSGAVALLIERHPEIDNDVSAIEALLYTKVAPLTGATAARGGRGRLAL